MRRKQILHAIACGFLWYAAAFFVAGCAQVGMPTGGLRDTIPPVLLKTVPENGTLRFDKDRIVLTFDEYVQLQDVQKNLVVSPLPKVNPNVDYKLRTVTIKLRDTLQPNTTYKIELGNSIRDLNENNPFPDFTYVFSTGTYLDSLTLSGNVEVAETGKYDTTLQVFLYKNLADSAVFLQKPTYLTKVDKQGDFVFKNLPPGTYQIFALKDEGGQKMYTSPKQLFAFADSLVTVSAESPKIQLFAYREERESDAKTPVKKSDSLSFSTSLQNGIQDLISPLVLTFNHPLKEFDNSRIVLTDTLHNPVPATITGDSTQIILKKEWPEDSYFQLIVYAGAGNDTSGHTLHKNDTIPFKTRKQSEYGSVKMTFQNLDKFSNPVIQFVKNKEVAYSFPLESPEFFRPLFMPGEYEIRILDDENKNGIWDPGHYSPTNKSLQKQPEKVVSLPQIFSIRAAWENERDIVL